MDWQNEFDQGNKEFLSTRDQEYFLSHAEKQSPFLTLIMCSDSRVHPNVILSDPINNIFTIQNIGNQIRQSEGSVDYGIYHLKTPLLMVMGHSGCGAINAAIDGFDNEFPSIRHALSHLSPGINKVCNSDQRDKDHLNLCCTVENIYFQVNWAVNKYHQLINDGNLTIIGSYYDFMNLQGCGPGKVYILNVNGSEIDNSEFTW